MGRTEVGPRRRWRRERACGGGVAGRYRSIRQQTTDEHEHSRDQRTRVFICLPGSTPHRGSGGARPNVPLESLSDLRPRAIRPRPSESPPDQRPYPPGKLPPPPWNPASTFPVPHGRKGRSAGSQLTPVSPALRSRRREGDPTFDQVDGVKGSGIPSESPARAMNSQVHRGSKGRMCPSLELSGRVHDLAVRALLSPRSCAQSHMWLPCPARRALDHRS